VYRLLRSLKRDEKAATAVEYGLIIALIFLAIVAAVDNVAKRTIKMWNNVSTEVSNH